MLKLKLTKVHFLKILLVSKNLKVFLLLCLPILAQLSCNTTEPTDNLKPGRRDYTWTVDTLNGLHNPRFRMWGNSPTDVWAVTESNWENSLSHFNGSNWASYGISGLATPNAIYGFSNTDVYIGETGSGRIWIYDGNNWNQFAQLTKDGHNNIWIENIWGESPLNFYAIGVYPEAQGSPNNSIIAHYEAGIWTMLNTNGLFGVVEHLYKNLSDNKIYLQVIGNQNDTDSTHIYEYKNDSYKKLYSSLWTKGLLADISLINNEVIFVLGNQIARRINNQFQTILNVNNLNFYQRIWGRNIKDIFLLMTDGLTHYNGSDVEYLFYFNQTPRTQIFGTALFEKDVFFLVYEANTGLSFVYHGILK